MPHHHLILTTTCEAGTVILFSRMSKLRLRQSETALSFSSDCRAPGASGNCRRRLPGNRARPAPSPPHFRPCALGLWRTALSGRDGSFPLTPSDANAKAVREKATSSPPLQKDFAGNSASSKWFWSQIPEGLGKGRIQKKQKCHRRGYNPDDDYSRQYAAQRVRKNTCFSQILTTALFWKVFKVSMCLVELRLNSG